jgi:Protein of unknown function (DUF3078)
VTRFAPARALPVLAAASLFAGSAAADDDLKLANKTDYAAVPKPDEPKKDAPAVRQGWDPRLSLAVNASFGDNRGVVGQADGGTLGFGIKFDAGFDYNRGKHEWRNSLSLAAGLTRTPVIPQFVKSSDLLGLESIYLYHLRPWFGPFARATMLTSMFRGADVRPAPVTYLITRPDGTVDTRKATQLTLSDPFQPMTLKQSVGPFIQPLTSEKANVEIRAGLGGQETLAAHQLAVVDDKATTEIEVKELTSVNQVGAEAAIDFWGTASDKRVTYRAGIDAMVPLAHTALKAGDTRGAFALMNLEMGAQISFKLVEWASLDYQIKAIREPQVLDAFQVRNSLLLSFGLSYGGEKADEKAEKK